MQLCYVAQSIPFAKLRRTKYAFGKPHKEHL